jgi:hypothetical protein
MTWLLVKLGIRLVGFIGAFWLAAAKNPRIKIQPRWAIPLVAGSFAVFNVGLYWLLKLVLNLATFGVASFVMPFLINLGLLVATLRLFQKREWFVVEGIRATLYLALLLTAVHGVFWFGLDYLPATL